MAPLKKKATGQTGTAAASPVGAAPKKQGTPTTSGVEGYGAAGVSTAAPPVVQPGGPPSGGGSRPATDRSYAAANTGGGSGATIGGTGSVQDTFNGFASRYDPTQTQQLYNRPETILEDVMKDRGQPLGNAYRNGMDQYAQTMRDIVGLLQMSGSLTGADQSDEARFNSMAQMMGQGMGPGGAAVDYNAALGMLMKPQGALDEYLFGLKGDPNFGLAEQAQSLNPMFAAATSGVNPDTQRAMASAMRAAQGTASADLAHGGTNPRILDYLKKNLGGIIPGM